MGASRTDGDGRSGQTEHSDGMRAARVGPIAKLPIDIVAPAHDAARCGERAGMGVAGRDAVKFAARIATNRVAGETSESACTEVARRRFAVFRNGTSLSATAAIQYIGLDIGAEVRTAHRTRIRSSARGFARSFVANLAARAGYVATAAILRIVIEIDAGKTRARATTKIRRRAHERARPIGANLPRAARDAASSAIKFVRANIDAGAAAVRPFQTNASLNARSFRADLSCSTSIAACAAVLGIRLGIRAIFIRSVAAGRVIDRATRGTRSCRAHRAGSTRNATTAAVLIVRQDVYAQAIAFGAIDPRASAAARAIGTYLAGGAKLSATAAILGIGEGVGAIRGIRCSAGGRSGLAHIRADASRANLSG